MSPVSDLRETLLHLPFSDLTGFDIEHTFLSAKERIVQLMDNHCITKFMNENYIKIFSLTKTYLCAITSMKMHLHSSKEKH